MPLPNSENTAKGKKFQNLAAKVLSLHFGTEFLTERKFPIGHPSKDHKFDLVSTDLKFVGESKNYSWTETGNTPSAKIGFINEAVFYLYHLPKDKNRFVVLRKAVHPKQKKTLAEYYFETNKHLLNGVFVVEIDEDSSKIRIFESAQ